MAEHGLICVFSTESGLNSNIDMSIMYYVSGFSLQKMGLGHVRNRILYNLVGGELEIKKMTGETKLCFNMVQYMNSEILNEAQKTQWYWF